MKLVVASKNPIKVDAVSEIIREYEMFSDAVVHALETESGVSDQPMSMEETIRGAMNRAVSVFGECHYSFGIESGLMPVPNSKSGYMDFTACVIFDGKEFHLGLSSSFEYPKRVMHLVLHEGYDISTAFQEVGLTTHPKVGIAEGGIGILTKGRLVRKEYTKQAIRMALIHLENGHLF